MPCNEVSAAIFVFRAKPRGIFHIRTIITRNVTYPLFAQQLQILLCYFSCCTFSDLPAIFYSRFEGCFLDELVTDQELPDVLKMEQLVQVRQAFQLFQEDVLRYGNFFQGYSSREVGCLMIAKFRR